MLKDVDKYEKTHFSYEDYKKKRNKEPNRYLVVFTSVFVIGVLLILGVEKILSPNVDVEVGYEDESYLEEESDRISSLIDERLKRIQMEDEGKKLNDEEMFSPELDVKVVIPKTIRKTTGEIESENLEHIEKQKTKKQEETVENATPTKKVVAETDNKTNQPELPTPKPPATVNAKVVVGYYATEKQAEVAKSIIHDAGLGVTPIVKNLGGYYTLQVGSYSSREKAQQAANGLLKSNFPARVIVE